MRVLYIFGNKSTSLEIRGQSILLGFDKTVLVSKENDACDFCINENHLQFDIKLDDENYYFVPMADMNVRKKCFKMAEELGLESVSIISKQVFISSSANIGKGVYIAPMTCISENVNLIGRSVINYNTTIGHDTTIHRNVIINPGVRIGGNCVIGENTLIGANSFIAQGITIGENVSIDAMTHVFRDIPDNSICTSRTLKVYKKRGY